MTPLFSYFLQGSLVTAIFLLFYKLLLRRDTFFKWSRWYFITAALAGFILPLVDVSVLFTGTTTQSQVIAYLPDLSFSAVRLSSNPWESFIRNLLYAGIVVMAVRLLMQMVALVQLRKNKRISKQHPVKIVELKEHINPFSFFNEIYVNPQLHSEAELEEIIRHEQFHIQQKHTLDILLGEVLTIVFWFNPFAWILKNELKQNLEFLTDKLVLESGIDAKHYQYNLLKVSVLQNNITAANHFHFLKLKNRIIMMNKKQTNPYHAIKFLLLVPIVAVLLMAFAERKQLLQSFNKVVLHDTLPPTAPLPPLEKLNNMPSASPPVDKKIAADIKQMDVINKDGIKKVTITLKNGTKEIYNLNKEEDKKKFEKKYGKLADAPAPPPAPPADIQSPVAAVDVVVAPDPPASPDVAIGTTVHVRNEVPINDKGYYLSIADDNGECVVIVKNKDKKIMEALRLTEWDAAKDSYEKKYGKIPAVHEHTTTIVTTPTGSSYNKTISTNSSSPAKVEVAVTVNKNNSSNTSPTVANTNKTNAATTVNTKNTVTVTTSDGEKLTTPAGKLKISTSDESTPLYVVDGKIVSKEEVDKIDPGKIESINILKGDKATDEYGEKGKNGVIKINLKK